jgi:ubiquinone/menaquinone biosynthesis C-methylase UbiE
MKARPPGRSTRATGCVVGIDISEDLIDFATKHKPGETIEYRVGNATALPIDAKQFDVAASASATYSITCVLTRFPDARVFALDGIAAR